jgi:rRNA small subunit pseudouridine methyltransferase Nep1
MSFHLMLVDAEIEWLPFEAMVGPAVRTCCSSGADMHGMRVLESNLHQDLLATMSDRSRRGRPDIAHAFLVMTSVSAPRIEGRLDMLVHTRDNVAIRFARKAIVDRDYTKFLWTIARLFEGGEIGMGEWRIWMETKQTLPKLLEAEKLDFVIALSPNGIKQDLRTVVSMHQGKEVGIIIGGFPEGDYLSPVYELADLVVSLGDEILAVPEVTAQVLAAIP